MPFFDRRTEAELESEYYDSLKYPYTHSRVISDFQIALTGATRWLDNAFTVLVILAFLLSVLLVW